MKTTTFPDVKARPGSVQRGFTLAEVLVSMAIAMVLMGALATLFASSITARQQVDREGQKIESARISLDTLAEDIRLAGYWGNYTPAGRWSSVSWQPVSALEKIGSVCTAAALTQGWANLGASPSGVRIPIPILGFEAHSGSTTQTIDADITGCLPNYVAGTDVLMIRRARTIAATAGALTAAKTYLQVSACATEIGSTDFTVGLGSATFTLTRLGCNPSPVAPIWELITRVYYVASENEPGDGIPSLKMIDLSAGGMTAVTVARNVVDMHLEYGIDQSGYLWTASSVVLPLAARRFGDYVYRTVSGGTTGTAFAPCTPTGVPPACSTSDGAVSWDFYKFVDGSVDAFGRSTTDPQRLMPNGSTTGVALGEPWGGDTNWHDVTAVKLWVIARDPETTKNYTNAKEFILGSITVAAATVNARGTNGSSYRYKSMGSTVKVVNMSGRREDVLP